MRQDEYISQDFASSVLDRMHADRLDDGQKGYHILQEAWHWWNHLSAFRSARSTVRNYIRGRQWAHTMTDPDDDTKSITERDWIERQGRVPYVINILSSTLNNLKGQLRQNKSDRAVFAVDQEGEEEAEQMNMALRSVRRINKADLLEADQFEEHLMSGSAVFKLQIKYNPTLNRNEVHYGVVRPNRFFYNRDVADRRLEGLRICGELHDLTRQEIIEAFAHDAEGNFRADVAEELVHGYDYPPEHVTDLWNRAREASHAEVDAIDFYGVTDNGLYRILEVWRYEHELVRYHHDPLYGTYSLSNATDAEAVVFNEERRRAGLPEVVLTTRYEPVWHVYFLTPWGRILHHSRSPYLHEEHPYVISLARLMDGETWGLIENMIDPQRWLNRLASMIDHSLGVAAKGVLVVPEDAIPADTNLEQIAETWRRSGGVIKLKLKQGMSLPEQIATNAIPAGTFDMLQNLRLWIEETSGVTGPMRGMEVKSGTPAALHQQQVIQSSLTTLDFFESYFEALRELDTKSIKVIMQAWSEPRAMKDRGRFVQFDPEQVAGIEYDVAMANVADTATYRQLFEKDLQEFLTGGYIDFRTYLSLSSHPKAKQLLAMLEQQMPGLLNLNAAQTEAAMLQEIVPN